VPPIWAAGYAALAAELDFDIANVERAAGAVRAFIDRVASV
jgi:hypothetical protein